MRNPVNGYRAAWLSVGLAFALPGLALGEPEAKQAAERWVPALAVFGAVLTQESAPHPKASGEALFGEPGAGEEVEHWVPALAVIVPVLEAEESAVGPSPSGEDLSASPVVGSAAEATAVAASHVGERPATGQSEAGNEAGRRLPALAVVLLQEAEETGRSAVGQSEPGGDLSLGAVADATAEATTVAGSPVGEHPAASQPEANDETGRWVPALAVLSGVLVQPAEARAWSSDFVHRDPLLCKVNPPDYCVEPVRPGVFGDDLMVSPFVGASGELMTPGLRPFPGRPRLFLHGDALASFGFTRDVAKEGAPGKMVDPETTDLFPSVSIDGQGSATSVELKPLVVSAGAGIAFTIDAWGRRLRIKPSFEYIREEIEVTGAVKRAVQTRRASKNPPVNASYLFIEMQGSAEEIYHGIGPGLEFEVDTARAGPFVLTIFVSGQAYKILGKRRLEFTDSVEISDELLPAGFETQTVDARWSFEKDAWSYRGGVGLRFRWLPE